MKTYFSNQYAWLNGIFLLFALLTYRSFNHTIFYLNWIVELIIFFLFVISLLHTQKITKDFKNVFLLVFAWVLVGAIMSIWAFDKIEHFKILIISSFYMLTSLCVSHVFIRSNINFPRFAYFVLVAWSLINFILFILFLYGIYVPVKNDFSGVFHDRNVFSITTVIVILFAVGLHYKENIMFIKKIIFVILIMLSIGMILASKSVTGLLGVLLFAFFISLRLSLIKKLILYTLIISVLMAILFIDNPLSYRIDRFYTALTGGMDNLGKNESAYVRVYLIISGINLAIENILTGIGINNASYYITWPLKDIGSFLHNTYLDILTGGGVFLFFVYYAPIFYSLFWLINNKKKVMSILNLKEQKLWFVAFSFLSFKLVYDMTWTTYFEFFIVFSVIFAIYSTSYLKQKLKYEKNTLHR